MINRRKTIGGLLIIVLTLFIFFIACAHSRPPKPGPDFVWVKAYTTPEGKTVPGHWKHVGPGVKGKTWVPGHHGPRGKWVPGHWR